jgi:hypothetical protein
MKQFAWAWGLFFALMPAVFYVQAKTIGFGTWWSSTVCGFGLWFICDYLAHKIVAWKKSS